MGAPPLLLTLDEAADSVRVSRRTLERHAGRDLVIVRIGSRRLVDPEDLRAWERARLRAQEVAQEKAWRRKNPGWVYFVHAPQVERIKIGFASDFEARFASMRTDSPVALVPLLVERGTRKTERRYHSRFAEFRRNGEWFEATRQLLVFIASRAAKQKESG